MAMVQRKKPTQSKTPHPPPAIDLAQLRRGVKDLQRQVAQTKTDPVQRSPVVSSAVQQRQNRTPSIPQNVQPSSISQQSVKKQSVITVAPPHAQGGGQSSQQQLRNKIVPPLSPAQYDRLRLQPSTSSTVNVQPSYPIIGQPSPQFQERLRRAQQRLKTKSVPVQSDHIKNRQSSRSTRQQNTLAVARAMITQPSRNGTNRDPILEPQDRSRSGSTATDRPQAVVTPPSSKKKGDGHQQRSGIIASPKHHQGLLREDEHARTASQQHTKSTTQFQTINPLLLRDDEHARTASQQRTKSTTQSQTINPLPIERQLDSPFFTEHSDYKMGLKKLNMMKDLALLIKRRYEEGREPLESLFENILDETQLYNWSYLDELRENLRTVCAGDVYRNLLTAFDAFIHQKIEQTLSDEQRKKIRSEVTKIRDKLRGASSLWTTPGKYEEPQGTTHYLSQSLQKNIRKPTDKAKLKTQAFHRLAQDIFRTRIQLLKQRPRPLFFDRIIDERLQRFKEERLLQRGQDFQPIGRMIESFERVLNYSRFPEKAKQKYIKQYTEIMRQAPLLVRADDYRLHQCLIELARKNRQQMQLLAAEYLDMVISFVIRQLISPHRLKDVQKVSLVPLHIEDYHEAFAVHRIIVEINSIPDSLSDNDRETIIRMIVNKYMEAYPCSFNRVTIQKRLHTENSKQSFDRVCWSYKIMNANVNCLNQFLCESKFVVKHKRFE